MATPENSIVTVIEGRTDAAWQPRHVQDRFSTAKGEPAEERLRVAELRRADIRSELVARVAAHHARVKSVKQKQDRRMSVTDRLLGKHSRADARRNELQNQRVQRVAEHHQRVETVVETVKRKVPAWKLQQRHRQAEERREKRLREQRKLLSDRAEKVMKAREVRREHEEKARTKSAEVVSSFRLDAEAVEDASFEQLQRKLASRKTVDHAKDLLELLSKGFEKVMAEEKKRVSEETPIVAPSSPPRSPANAAPLPPSPSLTPGGILGTVTAGKVPLNPRIFLSAFICMGGTMEGATPQSAEMSLLEESVKQHAVSLIDALHGLLACLEQDAQIDRQQTKDLMKNFACEWAAYTTSFEAWRKNDKRALLEHYIGVYSEMERGRVDILAETAQKGTRRPEEHAELMSSIEESLERVRSQIEKLSGEEGTEALGRRLQEMYAEQGLTPNRTPNTSASHLPMVSPSPLTSDIECDGAYASADSTAPKKVFDLGNSTSAGTASSSVARMLPLDGASSASVSPRPTASSSIPLQVREKLQTLVLKAKLAHDTIFKLDTLKEGGDSSDESRSAEASDASTDGTPQRVPVTIQRIKQAAEKAFWDLAAEELRESPPNVARISGALDGVKSLLLEVTPKRMAAALKKELADSLDWDTLAKGFSSATLSAVVKYFVGKVHELEAPADAQATRDSSAAILTHIEEHPSQEELHLTVPKAMRYLHKKLEDLSQSIHKARKTLIGPLLAQDAEQLVRQLYREEVAAGLHSFDATRRWLRSSLSKMLPLTAEGGAEGQPRALYTSTPPLSMEDVLEKGNKLYTVAPAVALLDSVLYPGDSSVSRDMPETLRLHRDFMRRIADRVQLATLAAAMSGLAGQVAGNPKVMKPVAEEVVLMLQTPGMRIESIIDQVAHIVDREHTELIPTAKRDLLLSMLRKVANPEERLYSTYLSRLGALLLQAVLTTPAAALASLPSTPFANVAPQVTELLGMLQKLTSHNVQWCRPFYDPILSDLSAEFNASRQQALDDEEL